VIRASIATLGVALILLAATLAWELSAFSARHPADLPRPPVQSAASRTAEPDHAAEWVSTIQERPLFSPARRPVQISAADAGGPAVPQGLPRLTGVLVGPFGRNAIFAADGSKPVVVTEGGKVDAWTVRSIEAGSVKVDGPGGAITLQPSFAASPAATTGSFPAGQPAGSAPRR
jgi:hypothetical protein